MVEIPDSLLDRLKAREAALVAGFGCGELAGAPGWAAFVDGPSTPAAWATPWGSCGI